MARSILILGAGELGTAIADALLVHPLYNSSQISLTFAIRPDTLRALNNDPKAPRSAALLPYRTKGISFASIDLIADTEESLAQMLGKYNCIVHAGAMTLPEGTQIKVTRAALAAGVEEYIPWQWGVDYDVIGPTGGLGLFREQCEVRDLLRGQARTKWFIVSCGVFMSFLFEDFWGVVVRDTQGKIVKVRCLGGWNHLVTATTVEDIAKCNADLLLVDKNLRDAPVYIAGDTLSYDEFATLVGKVVGKEVDKEAWSTDWLESQAAKESEDKLWKYRVVFSEDRGLAWKKEGTYNDKKSLEMEEVEEYMKRLRMS